LVVMLVPLEKQISSRLGPAVFCESLDFGVSTDD
jgi:hypothetical protein